MRATSLKSYTEFREKVKLVEAVKEDDGQKVEVLDLEVVEECGFVSCFKSLLKNNTGLSILHRNSKKSLYVTLFKFSIKR
jgi:hypothetical protein